MMSLAWSYLIAAGLFKMHQWHSIEDEAVFMIARFFPDQLIL